LPIQPISDFNVDIPGVVLLVEDSRTVGAALTRALQERGIETRLARTIAEAMKRLEAEPVDLVLLDLGLPDADGLSGLELIAETYPELCVVILTGEADQQLAVSALQKGAQDYLVKGEEGQLLMRTLAFAHERHRVRRAVDEMASELRVKNEALNELNKTKDRFLGMAAHDLRNPLTAIIGFSRLLEFQLDGRIEATQVDFIQRITRSATFMLTMVEDLLDMSAIESGQLKIEKQMIDLGELLRDNVAMNAELAASKSVSVRLEEPKTTLAINVDPRRIEQVLNNLVSNAVKFSKPGSSVVLRARGTGQDVSVSVFDEGPGIPKDEQSSLFKAFGRTSVRAPGGEKSTGLGLAIVKKIVEVHGGRVGLRSQVGEGTEFYFTLPLSVPSPRSSAPPGREPK